MKLKLLLREALRLHRAQPLRTAIVGGIIIVGTMLGTAEPGAGFLVVMLVVLILTVARQSPRPERLAAEAAWRRTGATRMTIRNIGVMESMTLTLAATLIGALAGVQFALLQSHHDFVPTVTYLVAQCIVVTAVSFASRGTTRISHQRKNGFFAPITRVGLVVRILTIPLLAWWLTRIVRGIDTNFTLLLGGFAAHVVLVAIGLMVTRPVINATQGLVTGFPKLRGLSTPALRTPFNPIVRVFAIVFTALATTASILGASVEARPLGAWNGRPIRELKDSIPIHRLTVTPTNVVIIRMQFSTAALIPPPPTTSILSTPTTTQDEQMNDALREFQRRAELAQQEGFTTHHLDLLRRAAGDAHAIVLNVVIPKSKACVYGGCGTVVTQNNELAALYRNAGWTHPRTATDKELNVPITRPVVRSTEGNGYEKGYARQVRATFDEAVFDFVDPSIVHQHHWPTAQRAVVLVATAPLSNARVRHITAVMERLQISDKNTATLIGPYTPLPQPKGQLFGGSVAGSSKPHRSAPFAATTAANRWSITSLAAAISILGLLAALGVQTLDRRAAVRTIERVGATPGQVRGAAALQTAITIGVITWFNVAGVAVLVKIGTSAFNEHRPDILVPFRIPWDVIAFLTLGVPLLAAGLAALIARPFGLTASGEDGRRRRHQSNDITVW